MGKGDRRSRKGKIWRHSFGIARKRNTHKRPAFVPKVKKEKKVALPVEEKIVVPQVEAISPPIETQQHAAEVAEVVTAPAAETVAAHTEEKAEAKKAAKPKKPAAEKKAKPAPKKEAKEKEKKPAPKKPAKKK